MVDVAGPVKISVRLSSEIIRKLRGYALIHNLGLEDVVNDALFDFQAPQQEDVDLLVDEMLLNEFKAKAGDAWATMIEAALRARVERFEKPDKSTMFRPKFMCQARVKPISTQARWERGSSRVWPYAANDGRRRTGYCLVPKLRRHAP